MPKSRVTDPKQIITTDKIDTSLNMGIDTPEFLIENSNDILNNH